MYKKEIKNELRQAYCSINNINQELIKLKIVAHNLEKLGYNADDFYKILDNLGVEFKKTKDVCEDYIYNTLKK